MEYPYNERFEDLLDLEPIIIDFNGELFGDQNITVNGYYAGAEKLSSFDNMLYCKDDNSIIWRDHENGNIYRLYNSKKEKICPHEECRNDIDRECSHMQFFDCLYTDGYLYFTDGGESTIPLEYNGEERRKITSRGAFIYRYNINTYEFEKLMEFQGVNECGLAVNGRYLYAQTYGWEYIWNEATKTYDKFYKADFSITRIDLYEENAVIVYSDLKNPDDLEKICDPDKFRFMDDKIVMPVNNFSLSKSSINICNVDMKNIVTLIEFDYENIRDLYMYGRDIYFVSDEGFCRVNMDVYTKYNKDNIAKSQDSQNEKTALLDAKKREILNKNIGSFCIDGDFLYYVLNEKLYRVKLDYDRDINFNTAVKVSVSKTVNYYFMNDWKVYSNYLYAFLISENAASKCRINFNSGTEPYIFYNFAGSFSTGISAVE